MDLSMVNVANAVTSFKAMSEGPHDLEMHNQLWRLHLLDMLAPYCEHDKMYPMRSEVGKAASDFWGLLMAECSEFEERMGF